MTSTQTKPSRLLSRLILAAVMPLAIGACAPPAPADAPGVATSALVGGTALFIAGSTSLGAADTAVKNRLTGLGLSVVVESASAAASADANGKAVVVISSTVSPTSVGTKFRASAVPVLTWESQIYDDMGMTPTASSNFGTQSSQTSATIATPSHPMAAGLTGTVSVSSASSAFNWGKPAATAVRIANLPSDSTKALIFAYDTGAAMSGLTAPARRVGFFLGDATATTLTANGWALFDAAVTWATGAAATPTKVEILVSNVDDWVYVTVGGVRRKISKISLPETRTDISSWFAKGANNVRIQGINTGGPASWTVQLYVDNNLVVNEVCPSTICNGADQGVGILRDTTYQVQVPVAPAAQNVTFTSSPSGKLYVNNVYTGMSTPATMALPQGSYTAGLGISQDVPGAYTGKYYEAAVTVGGSSQTVNLTQGSPLPFQHHTRVGLLPIRQMIQDANNVGVLTQHEIDLMVAQASATKTGFFEPFSYGLNTWDITLLPTVENTPIHRPADTTSSPDTDRLLTEAGLTGYLQTYDYIIFLYPVLKADGTAVSPYPCCGWATKQAVDFMSGFVDGGDTSASPFLLHESLHNYEFSNQDVLNHYNGINGLHGGLEHGYQGGGNGEIDWVEWYRAYMRGQGAELDGMRGGTTWPSIPPSADLWIGVFDVLRTGIRWQ